LLYRAHADLILNGHEHNYERFAPQNPGGRPAPDPADLARASGQSFFSLVAFVDELDLTDTSGMSAAWPA